MSYLLFYNFLLEFALIAVYAEKTLEGILIQEGTKGEEQIT